MKKYLSKEKLFKLVPTIVCIAILILVSMVYYKNFLTEMYTLELPFKHETYKIWFLTLGSISFIISTLIILKISLKKNIKDKNIHKYYFVISLLFGLLYLVVIPMFAQSDEPAHYLRAYELSDGYIVTPTIDGQKANSFESKVVNTIYNNDKDPERKTYEDITNISKLKDNKGESKNLNVRASNYSPINYIPHTIGIKIGKILKLNPYYCGIIGRFLSLIFCISLITLGIKLLPSGKKFAFVFFTSPVVLSYSSSFSADGTTISYIFLFISYILNLRDNCKKIEWKQYFIIALLCACVALSKSVYLPIIFAIFLIPEKCFRDKKYAIISKIALVAFGIICSALWVNLCAITVDNGGTNKWIITQPFKYLIVLVNTILESGYNQLENIFAGHFLCHGQTKPYSIISFLFIMIALISYFNEDRNKKNQKYENILIILAAVGIYILIATAMYIGSTKEFANVVNGVQGRYLIPIIILLMMLKVKKIFKINEKILWIINVILNYCVILTMISAFVF